MRTTIEIEEVRELLHDRGLRAKVYADEEDGSSLIVSASSGLEWIVMLLETHDSVSLMFEIPGILTHALRDPLRFCSTHNRKDILCGTTAFVTTDDDGDEVVKIRKLVQIDRGVSDDWVDHQLSIWIFGVNQFSIALQRELDQSSDEFEGSDNVDDEILDAPIPSPLQALMNRVEAGDDPVELLDEIIANLDSQGKRAKEVIRRLENTDWESFARDTSPFRNQ